MAQGNYVFLLGDITGDIYFDYLKLADGATLPFLRMYLMNNGSREANAVKGVRILVYGDDAIIVMGHVQKGSRIGVQGHIQLRYRPNTTTPVFEVVAEHIEYIRNIDYARGREVMAEMKAKGKPVNHETIIFTPHPSLPELGETHDIV